MDGYDQNTIPYLSNPLAYTGVSTDDYMTTLPTLGHPEQRYQPTDYPNHDFGSTTTLPNLPLPPVLTETDRNFSTSYDDFTFENLPQDAQEVGPQPPSPDPATSLNRDDALLNFQQPPTYNFTLLDYSLRHTSLSLSARLHGMFFMADATPTLGLFPQMAPPELTCYRRNLFQVTGSITLPRNLRYILTDNGDRIPIVAQELAVSATESVEGHPVKLISVPWKTPANSSAPSVPEDKTEQEPTTIPLDTMSNQDMDADYATFPIAWKRLQFRIATANNGRRKELQQHFVARLKLVATLSTGLKVSIAEVKSAAIVVRGRSPRNFSQRRDLAVGDKATTRRATTSRTNSDSATPNPKSPLKREHSGDNTFASSFAGFTATNAPNKSNTFSSSNNFVRSTSGPASSSAPTQTPTSTFKTPTLPSSKSSASPQTAPQPLSLTDDYSAEANTPKRAKTQRPQKSPRNTTATRPHPYKNTSLPTLPSTKALLSNTAQKVRLPEVADKADMLYEYFPLGEGDLMPPVDAVYRPHVVHHISPVVSGGPAGKSQRYFSEAGL
ncbi:hypothetical protein OEA41_004137 [Lepraria neglecta]|uniref:NDT80 domain-containing protein n=1 Tax=Lepraria neglecta TaxID=209136 RepID=A0AAD9Z710_9LECA|nr:hypothetical protein OEA41_004137 [Lepraria neglecta]